jgi:hypothetical protein
LLGSWEFTCAYPTSIAGPLHPLFKKVSSRPGQSPTLPITRRQCRPSAQIFSGLSAFDRRDAFERRPVLSPAPVIVALPNTDKPQVIIAQALGEYVALSTVLSAFSDAWLALRDHLSRIDSSTWLIGVLSLVVVLYLWSRST